MPTDAPGELPTFLAAWAIVSAVAVPVVVAVRLLGRREAFWPRWAVVPFRGTLLDWLILYCGYMVVMSLGIVGLSSAGFSGRSLTPVTVNAADYEVSLGAVAGGASAATFRTDSAHAIQLRQMAAGFLALPVLIGGAAFLRHVVHDIRPGFDRRSLPADVARGAVAGVVFTPVVHAVYWFSKTLNAAWGGVEQAHPLAETGVGHSAGEIAFFLVSVCLVVPWIEELLFRGVMLRWLARRQAHAVLVFAIALAFAATRGLGWDPKIAPTAFVAGLMLLSFAVEWLGSKRPRFPVRTVRAVLASSALFAAAHSAVWPSPVPLFVLACGLGYLTVRTGRITAAVVAHGLFNAVSSVILIRQSAG